MFYLYFRTLRICYISYNYIYINKKINHIFSQFCFLLFSILLSLRVNFVGPMSTYIYIMYQYTLPSPFLYSSKLKVIQAMSLIGCWKTRSCRFILVWFRALDSGTCFSHLSQSRLNLRSFQVCKVEEVGGSSQWTRVNEFAGVEIQVKWF